MIVKNTKDNTIRISVCDSLSVIETEAGEFIVPLSDDFEIKIKESKIV